MKKYLLLYVFLFLFLSCTDFNNNRLEGKWEGQDNNGKEVVLIFKKNNDFDMLTNNQSIYQSLSDSDLSIKDLSIKYEAIMDVIPHHLYIKVDSKERQVAEKMPLGIFKFSKGKLVIRESIEYTRTIGIIPVGKRYELPTDFNGPLMILKRK